MCLGDTCVMGDKATHVQQACGKCGTMVFGEASTWPWGLTERVDGYQVCKTSKKRPHCSKGIYRLYPGALRDDGSGDHPINLQFMRWPSFPFIVSSICQKHYLSWASWLRRDMWFCISINEMIWDNLIPKTTGSTNQQPAKRRPQTE